MKSKMLAVIAAVLLFAQIFALYVESASAEVNDPRIPLITPTPYGTLTTNPTVVAGGGGGAISVEGYFYYIQSYAFDIVRPIRGAEIEVYEDDGITGKQKMGQGYTDDNGHYMITGLHNPFDIFEWSGPDIYVEVHASNWVTEINDNPDWWGGSVYRFRTYPALDTGDRDHVNFGDCTCLPEQNRVFDIFETMQAGYWFMVEETGRAPPKVNTFYNDILQSDTAFYQGAGMGDQHGILSRIPDFIMDLYSLEALYYAASGLHFKTGSDNHRAVFHEYGHYVMDLYMDLSPPNSVSPHFYESNYNDQHGLVEGWANFFSAVVRYWWGAPVEEYRDDYPVETNYIGSGCEGAVAGILWDIIDSPEINGGTDDDGLTMYFQTIWDVFTQYDPEPNVDWPLGKDHPWTIYDFWDGFKRYNPGTPVSHAVSILGSHGVIFPDTEPPVNPNQFESNIPINTPSISNQIELTLRGAYDIFDGQQVDVKEYIIKCSYDSVDVTEYPPWDTWSWAVLPDIGGYFTWVSDPGLNEGQYWLNVRAIDSSGNFAPDTYNVGPFIIVEFGPATMAEFTNIDLFDIDPIVKPDTSVTLEVVANTGFTTTHYEVTNSDGSVTTGEQNYSNPFTLADFHLPDGQYTLRYYSVDDSGTGTENTRTITLDSTPPTTTVEISEPNTVVNTKVKITHLTSSSTISLNTDEHSGSGTQTTMFRINNAAYDLGWQAYDGPFQLREMSEGAYWLQYYSIDNGGNTEATKMESIVLDDSGPSIRIQLAEETTIQDRMNITSTAFDLGSGMGTVTYTINLLSRLGPVPVTGFVDLPATSLPNGVFTRQIDITQLQNGEYIITAKAEDVLGNVAELSCRYSLINIDVIDTAALLPKTTNAKTGRTVPIKFTLRTSQLIDPNQPFIYYESLTIKICQQASSTPIQTSIYGVDSKSYRIDTTAELYIVNFKTAPNPTTYEVTIYHGSQLIGSFTFLTTR